MTDVGYRSTSTVENSNTVDKPAGAQSTDCLRVVMELFNGGGNGASITVTPPGGQGWALVRRENSASMGLAEYIRNGGIGAETTYNFATTNSDFTAIACSAYTNVDTGTANAAGEQNGANSGGSSSTPATCTGFSVARSSGYLTWGCVTESAGGDKSPAGYTNIANIDTSSVGHVIQGAGTAGTASVAISSSVWCVSLTQLQPASGGGGGGAVFLPAVAYTTVRALMGVGR